MFDWLAPDLALPSLLALDVGTIRARGIQGLILDLDNTLVPYGHPSPSPDVAGYIEQLRVNGLPTVILSNARRGRAADVAAMLGLPHIGNACKPGTRGFRRALEMTGTPARQTAVVGDQLFRDVLGARRAGCFAVLVDPLSNRDFPGTTLLRGPEALLIRHLRARGRWPA